MSRLVSLLPSLTEVLCALGLEDQLVGVTHECDYPAGVGAKTVVTTTTLTHDLTSLEIEEQVREQIQGEPSLYGLNLAELQQLKPDLIFTQGLCDVCAVSETLVHTLARQLDPVPRVVSVAPTRLAHILDSIAFIAAETGTEDRAQKLLADARQRVDYIQETVQALTHRPRVFGLEWLDPPYVSGHWMPELIHLAGGTAWGEPGVPSRRVTWTEVADFAPEVVVVLPCGFTIDRTWQELHLLQENPVWQNLPAVVQGRVYIVDGNSYFNRPGPRILDSLEILAQLLHPQAFQGLAPPDSFIPYPSAGALTGC
ncbi:cobalamin-binding protein [Anthocerotibacter panamensis]|uniref:cobalamin-binding protein n=1 Tax=Anthocerotibacter panamensis TaxID=2857077 RepID=UPI001C4032E7|nr:cobalamin-binding protein [Anthocerotibacter panamensis]